MALWPLPLPHAILRVLRGKRELTLEQVTKETQAIYVTLTGNKTRLSEAEILKALLKLEIEGRVHVVRVGKTLKVFLREGEGGSWALTSAA
jgi:hypothetical protein